MNGVSLERGPQQARSEQQRTLPTPPLSRAGSRLFTVPSFPGPSPGSAVNKPGFPWRGSEASHVGGGGGSVSRTPATPPPERHPSSSQTAQWAVASRRRGCPWQREPQAGRGQTRWARGLKAKAEPGWGAHEPEAWGVGAGPRRLPLPTGIAPVCQGRAIALVSTPHLRTTVP